MPVLTFAEGKLRTRLLALPRDHRVAFFAACCERMIPNYGAFSRLAAWGDVKRLRECLDLVWDWLGDGSVSREELLRAMKDCEALTPDTEDFQVPFTSAALDAAAAVAATIQTILDGDSSAVTEVPSLARDSVYMFIADQARPDQLPEEAIAHNPLMQQELAKQEELVRFLDDQAVLRPASVAHLRRLAFGAGISNIGVVT